jgi:PTH1 family peptidyl-tRNA hydrolase
MLFHRRGGRNRAESGGDDADTWLIIGLGNPGKRYHLTRHNAGFMVVDRVHDLLPRGTARTRFQAELSETRDGDQRIVLVKPQTFMNDSGVAVEQVARWYKVPTERILVVCDELDLPFGTIRLRGDGSAGGHNGVASVIQRLRTQEFPRLRVGISRPLSGSTVPYVLAPFTTSEQKQLPEVIDRSARAALLWLREGIIPAMNEFNRKAEQTQRITHLVAPHRDPES